MVSQTLYECRTQGGVRQLSLQACLFYLGFLNHLHQPPSATMSQQMRRLPSGQPEWVSDLPSVSHTVRLIKAGVLNTAVSPSSRPLSHRCYPYPPNVTDRPSILVKTSLVGGLGMWLS